MDTSYNSWKDSLAGSHMLLGFKSTASVSPSDLEELAYRLTGTVGLNQENMQWAFWETYIGADGSHNTNTGRIIAETTSAYYTDYIDSYSAQITVDSTKYGYTWP